MPEGCSRTAEIPSDRNKYGSLCVTAKPVPYEWVSHVLVELGELHLHSFTLPSSLPCFGSCPYYDILTLRAYDKNLAQGTPAKFVPVEEGSCLGNCGSYWRSQ